MNHQGRRINYTNQLNLVIACITCVMYIRLLASYSADVVLSALLYTVWITSDVLRHNLLMLTACHGHCRFDLWLLEDNYNSP